MNKKPVLLPSLLSADFYNLSKNILPLEAAGVRVLHFDVMDGHFVANLTFGPLVIECLQPHIQSGFDVHLMVENPDRMVPWFDLPSVNGITIHVEIPRDIRRILSDIQSRGKEAGITLDPPTPVESLKPYLSLVDRVLVMTVKAGMGGQSFIKETLQKIEHVARIREEKGYQYAIQVDGGINAETIGWVLEAGAEEIVCGSSVFRAPDPVQAYQTLSAMLIKRK